MRSVLFLICSNFHIRIWDAAFTAAAEILPRKDVSLRPASWCDRCSSSRLHLNLSPPWHSACPFYRRRRVFQGLRPDRVSSGLTEAQAGFFGPILRLAKSDSGDISERETAWYLSLQLNLSCAEVDVQERWTKTGLILYQESVSAPGLTSFCPGRTRTTLQRKQFRAFLSSVLCRKARSLTGFFLKHSFKGQNSQELCNLCSWSACCKLLLAVVSLYMWFSEVYWCIMTIIVNCSSVDGRALCHLTCKLCFDKLDITAVTCFGKEWNKRFFSVTCCSVKLLTKEKWFSVCS